MQKGPRKAGPFSLQSLRVLGLDPIAFDVRFVEDDWEHPALGAAGLGWEVWAHGMEITQFTYFQQCGGLPLPRIACELTYGLERIALYLQNKDSVYDLVWATLPSGQNITYGDVHLQDEREWSRYNFEEADVDLCFDLFNRRADEAEKLLEKGLVLPAYDDTLKCSHAFNLLDARKAISVTERTVYIGRIRKLARACAKAYVASRGTIGAR